jgi:hypothetical protein
MRRFLLSLCLLLATLAYAVAQDTHQTLPSATRSDFNTVLQNFLLKEDANRLADLTDEHGWVVQTADPFNCLAVASGSRTLAAFACVAYTPNGYYATQPSTGIDLAASPGPACATDDLAWVVITDGLTVPGGNFTQILGTQYAVDCTSPTQPTIPTNATLLFLAHIVSSATSIVDLRPFAPGLPGQGGSMGGATLAEEMRIWWGDAWRSFVAEGCLHAVIASTSVVMPTCRAYIKDVSVSPPQMRAVKAPPSRFITYSAGDGVYWLLLHASLTETVSGWTREPGTPYLWRYAEFAPPLMDSVEQQPAVPPGGILLSKAVVDGGAIVRVGDLRVDAPTGDGAVNVMSPIFGTTRDCVTDDRAAIQAAINNSAWRGVYRVYLPAPAIAGCYLINGTLWASYDPTENPNHPGQIGAALDANVELFGDKSMYFNAQTAIRTTGSLLIAGTEDPILRSDPAVSVNGARLIAIHDLAFQGNSTTQPAILLDGSAGVSMERVSVWQAGEGGSGIWLTNYDRASLKELVLEGPRTPTSGNPPTAGSFGLLMKGVVVDNSGSALTSVHFRGWDRCYQIGESTPITVVNNNSALMTISSMTMINCNQGLWVGDGAGNLTFNAFQANGMFVDAVNLGDGANHITFVGGAINASAVGMRIGRGSTRADHVRIENMRISNIPATTGVGIRLDSTHSLSNGHRFEDIEFHCAGDDTGIPFAFYGVPRGGIMENNTQGNCLSMWGGSSPGGYEFFDRLTIPETSTSINTPYTNVSKLQFREPDPAALGILELWNTTGALDFPIVLANTCSAVLQIAMTGVMTTHYPIWRKPELATLGLEAEMWLTDGFINVKLCNNTTSNSADPGSQTYGATVLRVQ